MPAKEFTRPVFVLLLTALMPAAHAATPTELLTQLEAASTNEDADAPQKIWKQLTPDFERLSTGEQARFLVVQGLIQEDILRDIKSADESFNRVISMLDTSPEPAQ